MDLNKTKLGDIDSDHHGHDLETVPAFVSENSLHDRFLSMLTGAVTLGIIWFMFYWSTLPLASPDTESQTNPLMESR